MDMKRGLVRTQLGHIHYREAGAGPAIVLLHINQQSSEMFLEMMAVPALLLMGEHFYFGHRAGEIRARVRDLRYEVLPDTRFCACWERASEIAEKVAPFAAR